MRKLLLALVAMLGVAGALPATSSAEGLIDAAVNVVDLVDPVSVPGTVVYKITASNEGATPVLVDIKNTVTGGTINSTASRGIEDCTVTSSTVTCSGVLLDPVIDRVLHVGVTLPAGATGATSTATVTYVPADLLAGVDAIPGNNTEGEKTSVASTNEAVTYVGVGETIHHKKSSLTVRAPGNGVITRLTDANLSGVQCGTSTCVAEGLHIDFAAGGSGEPYSGYVLTKVNLGASEPCRGIGATKCTRLFYRTSSGQPMQELAACAGVYTDPTNDGPCVEQVIKNGVEFIWDVRMTSQDPDLGKLQL